MLVAFITSLKLGLAFGDESNYLHCCGPRMLNECTVLNFYAKASKPLTDLRVDVVFVNIMYSPIASLLRMLDVVVLIEFVSSLVIEASAMKVFAKQTKRL